MTEAVARTHLGHRRSTNEDSFLIVPEFDLYLVADGMGGHQAGEVASRVSVETVAEFVGLSARDSGITWPFGLNSALSFEANQLQNAVQLANHRVLAAARDHPERKGMGSTLVAASVRASRLVYAWVGDSRLYLYRDGTLRQLSADDSWAASMIRSGASPESVKAHPMRHLLTSALGSEGQLRVSPATEALCEGDLLMLCTDGLHGPVDDAAMTAILRDGGGSLERTADHLVEAANEAGGPDNITLVLARVGSVGQGARA
jgi:PPM family protein phosphatase